MPDFILRDSATISLKVKAHGSFEKLTSDTLYGTAAQELTLHNFNSQKHILISRSCYAHYANNELKC
jgi:hypothetical protein